MIEYATFKNTYGEAIEQRRMPKGQTAEISLKPAKAFTIAMARHACAIMMRDRLFFIDADDGETSLRSGNNIVGPDLADDIMMYAKMGDIPSKHLVIENEGSGVVRVTDIPSHDTWVHRRDLQATGF